MRDTHVLRGVKGVGPCGSTCIESERVSWPPGLPLTRIVPWHWGKNSE